MQTTPGSTGQDVPDVTVVVPTYGRVDLLDRCLDALLHQTLEGCRFEVIIVDDNPRRNTRQLVAVWRASAGPRGPFILYLPNHINHGPAAARNAGWRHARAPIIAFTDDDAVPAPGWLRNALDAFDKDTDAVSGKIQMPLSGTPTDYQREARRLEQAEFVAANCFCRKSILEKVEGFDERFQSGWREDNDLHFRLLKIRAAIALAPDALVIQPVRPAPWGASLFQLKKTAFDALLYKKHPQLYRQKIGATPRWDYSAIVAALLIALAGLVAGSTPVAATGAAAWCLLTAMFFVKRLRGTSRTPSHIAELVFTSALIPPLAVFWRIAGAIRFRVRFA
ncbi:glycosyltransferase family 2 protein [Massilia cavernae]|uniref:Glycosyltransferase n=1 Tax=Massilia cavernae TaxID=2320864 RepID=A0A418XFZ8_9BURK|nr:glycosyltransferase [Massilia cavernae]RJG11381.1 glycosyltransferase [Massilia cavernae]